jgi:hypothetical protein
LLSPSVRGRESSPWSPSRSKGVDDDLAVIGPAVELVEDRQHHTASPSITAGSALRPARPGLMRIALGPVKALTRKEARRDFPVPIEISLADQPLIGRHLGQPAPPQQKAVLSSGLPNVVNVPLDKVSDHLDGNSEAESVR